MKCRTVIVLTSFVSTAFAANGPGLSPGESFCPSCVGTPYTDTTTGQSGCCPLGTVYRPAACVPGTPTTTNPTCPADDGKLYVHSGITYKVYCDVTTNLGPDVGFAYVADPKACADLCASRPACGDATYRSSDQGCFMSSNILGPNYQGTPLAGAIVFAKQ